MSDALMRQWQMLYWITPNTKISTLDLMKKLNDEGYSATQRTVQRDLVRLSKIFPLVCDERSKPYGWSWNKHTRGHEVLGMDADTALTFFLAQKHLEPLLPHATIQHLEAHFKTAASVLDKVDTGKGTASWRNKVRVLNQGPGLKQPSINAQVQATVYDALLGHRKLDMQYQKYGAEQPKDYGFIRQMRPCDSRALKGFSTSEIPSLDIHRLLYESF